MRKIEKCKKCHPKTPTKEENDIFHEGWIDATKAKGKKIKWVEGDELKKVEKAIKEGFEASEQWLKKNITKKTKLRGANTKNCTFYCTNCGETMEKIQVGDWKDDLFG